jgi:hypothetical protein
MPHYAFIDCLIAAIGWPDKPLTVDLVCGNPCVRDIPDSGIFRETYQPSSISFQDEDHDTWNRAVVSTLSASSHSRQQKSDNAALWERTQKQV